MTKSGETGTKVTSYGHCRIGQVHYGRLSFSSEVVTRCWLLGHRHHHCAQALFELALAVKEDLDVLRVLYHGNADVDGMVLQLRLDKGRASVSCCLPFLCCRLFLMLPALLNAACSS